MKVILQHLYKELGWLHCAIGSPRRQIRGKQREDINPDEAGLSQGKIPAHWQVRLCRSLLLQQLTVNRVFQLKHSIILPLLFFFPRANLPSHNNYLYSDTSKMSSGLIAAKLNQHFLMSASLSSLTWADRRTVPVFTFHYTEWADQRKTGRKQAGLEERKLWLLGKNNTFEEKKKRLIMLLIYY